MSDSVLGRTAAPWWRRRVIVGGAAAALLIAIALAMWLPNRGEGRPSTGEAAAMHGMEIPAASDGAVHLTADQIAQFGITLGTVEQRRLVHEVRAAGAVAVAETRVVQVAPRFSGFVERLHVDFTGQRVSRGQPLLDVYSPELLAAQEELLLAKRLQSAIGEGTVPGLPDQSTDLLAAARRRLALWDVSESQIDEVLRTGRPLRVVTLYAPASGVVTEKNVVRGQAIESGQSLYTIADLSQLWVETELREGDAGSVRVGSGASLELGAFPGRTFKGRVEYVLPTLDAASRTVRARIVVSNADGILKPGMYVTVRLRTPTRTTLTAPSTSIIRTGERAVVFVDMGRGRLAPTAVETGAVAGDYTEILAGLEPGQRVVTSAQFILDSESNLAEVMRAMIGQTGASDAGTMTDMSGMDMPGMKGADTKGVRTPNGTR